MTIKRQNNIFLFGLNKSIKLVESFDLIWNGCYRVTQLKIKVLEGILFIKKHTAFERNLSFFQRLSVLSPLCFVGNKNGGSL